MAEENENELNGGGQQEENVGQQQEEVKAEGQEGAEEKQEEGKGAEGAEGSEAKPNKVMPEWVERRFGQLSAAKHAERTRAELAEAQLAEANGRIARLFGKGPQPGEEQQEQKPVVAENLSQQQIEQRAAEIVAQRAFNEACNKVADEGTKAYEDFGDAISVLNSGYGDIIQTKPEFLQTITELPNGKDVYYKLGKDPKEAERILALPPIKMALELGKLSNSLAKPAERAVSGAPAPIKPLNGLAGKKELTLEDASNPDVPIQEFMKIREKEVAERGRW